MKKKFLLITVLLVIIASFVIAFSVSASDDGISVTYCNFSGSVWKTGEVASNGSHTILTTKKSGNGTATLADGTVVNKEFYGWFAKDGTFYTPGETVVFTKDTQLFEAYGVTVNTAEDLAAVVGKNKATMFVKLGADITTSTRISADWATTVVDLNGHNLTVTHNDSAFYGYRGATIVIGKGKVTHAPTTLRTDDKGSFFQHDVHFYNYHENPQHCWIGKDVEAETPYNLVYVTAGTNEANVPNIEIAGTVSAKGIVRGAIFNNGNCNIHSSAKVTLTGEKIFNFTNTTGTNVYMNLSLDGEIILTSPTAVMFDDFVLSSSFEVVPVTSGKYTISSADAERFKGLLSYTHMLKETANENGTTTYSVVPSDCVHNWIVNEEANIEATLGTLGLDALICTECGGKIETVVAYAPSDIEISVSVNENGEIKEYTMLAGDVFEFSVTSKNGSSIVCEIIDVIYKKNDIVKLEIPYGVNLINIFSMQSLKELTFMDNSTVDFKKGCVSSCPSLEKIVLGTSANTVVFTNGGNENTEAGIFVNCPKLETLDVSKVSANFNNYSFASNKTIKHLILGEGKTYNFGEYAFAHSQLTEVIIPDNTPITYKKKSFAETTTIEYVYIGANCIADKKISDQSSLFGGNSNLSKVVLMDIEYIGQWVLSTKKTGNKYEALCDLVVYAHSENLSLHNESFNDRTGNYIVYLYTATKTLSQLPTTSNYVVFTGIGHAYVDGVITEPTCATPGKGGYSTDCPCNIDYRENTYKSVSNKLDQYKNKEYAALGKDGYDIPVKEEHTISNIIKEIDYKNGFLSSGFVVYKCLYCDEAAYVEETASCKAIFAYVGYSMPLDGSLALVVGYTVDQEALENYESVMGTLEYGVVGALTERLEGKAPLAQTTAPVVKAPLNGYDINAFDFIIRGFNEDQCDLAVTMCAYVYDGEKYVYLQKTQSELPYSITINQIIAEATA